MVALARDLSIIQQFEALHLSAERGGLYGLCAGQSVWSRGLYECVSMYVLMTFDLAWFWCQTSEEGRKRTHSKWGRALAMKQ